MPLRSLAACAAIAAVSAGLLARGSPCFGPVLRGFASPAALCASVRRCSRCAWVSGRFSCTFCLTLGALLLLRACAIAAVFVDILAVVLPVFARILTIVVIVVPRVVVHVAAAVPSVRTVVVVVVHRRADRDAGGKPDETRRDRSRVVCSSWTTTA